jgi:hypothetical protein
MNADTRSTPPQEPTSSKALRWKRRWAFYLVIVVGLGLAVMYRWTRLRAVWRGPSESITLIEPGPKPAGWDEPPPEPSSQPAGGSPSQWVRRSPRVSWPSTANAQRGIAVLPFGFPDNEPTLAPVAASASDVIAGRLAQDPRCTIVDREHLNLLLKEHALALAGMVDPRTATEVGKLIGATTIVTGQLLPSTSANCSIVASAYSVADGRLLGSVRDEAPMADLLEAVLRVADALAQPLQIELEPLPPTALDHHPDASLHRMRAMTDIVNGQYVRAIMSLMKVERLDPNDVDAVYWMGLAYARAAMPGEAATELRRYLQRSPDGRYARDAQHLLSSIPADPLPH